MNLLPTDFKKSSLWVKARAYGAAGVMFALMVLFINWKFGFIEFLLMTSVLLMLFFLPPLVGLGTFRLIQANERKKSAVSAAAAAPVVSPAPPTTPSRPTTR